MITRKLTIDYVALDITQGIHSLEEAVAAVIVVGYTAGITGIVSGSIAVSGNILYWIEKQGRCKDSEVRIALATIKGKLAEMTVQSIESLQQFRSWLFANDQQIRQQQAQENEAS